MPRCGQIWQEFKKLTLTLEERYEDRTLYHLVGFLVATATSDKAQTRGRAKPKPRVLLDLLDARSNSTGTDFRSASQAVGLEALCRSFDPPSYRQMGLRMTG